MGMELKKGVKMPLEYSVLFVRLDIILPLPIILLGIEDRNRNPDITFKLVADRHRS